MDWFTPFPLDEEVDPRFEGAKLGRFAVATTVVGRQELTEPDGADLLLVVVELDVLVEDCRAEAEGSGREVRTCVEEQLYRGHRHS